jgi:hypothetical protein
MIIIFHLPLFVYHQIARIRLSLYSDSLFLSFVSVSSNFFCVFAYFIFLVFLRDVLPDFSALKTLLSFFYNIHLLPSLKHVHTILL